MKDTLFLYTQLLGIAPPWQVTGVELKVNEREVRVHVAWDASAGRLACPVCGKPGPGYDQREERVWRHLDSCEFQTWLVASIPRIECEDHGVQSVEVPWSRPHSRFTLAFESFALVVLQATKTQSEAAGLLKIGVETLHDLKVQAVERGLSRRDPLVSTPHLTLDETSQGPRHQYVTILTDGERVLEVVEDRTQKAAQIVLETGLSATQRASVEVVTMDLWPAYQTAKERVVPEATLVYDRFHLSQDLNEAVDATRRAEAKGGSEAKALLKGTKYLWLKAPTDLNEKQQARMEILKRSGLETVKVWSLKEDFRRFWEMPTETEGKRYFDQWRKAVKRLGNRALETVAESFQTHLGGLLAYFRQRVSNAAAEGMNSRIQTIKSNARGFRDAQGFRRAILFFLGQLDFDPLTSP